MPWIKAVVPQHRQSFRRDRRLGLADLVDVFIVAPGNHQRVDTAVGGVDAVLRGVERVGEVGVFGEGVGVDVGGVKSAAD